MVLVFQAIIYVLLGLLSQGLVLVASDSLPSLTNLTNPNSSVLLRGSIGIRISLT
jgi:hypothetical protein